MSDIAISVENLSKKFRIGTGNSPAYHRLSEALTGIPRMVWNSFRASLQPTASILPPQVSSFPPASDFWALKDVSFEVKQGEVVGIIGRNGAGKSTLLKILSRITEPTSGRFGVRGRVASLLEVGTGFHPELTGRENIYVSGITLGMTRSEIKKRFDEIVDFSGVEKFLDTPVKHYSSGMQVRLGFAVAAHLESEILIVDEVLAVGDSEFQKKCLGSIQKAATAGRTILFVSHNLTAITNLCTSALLVNHGRLGVQGRCDVVCSEYRSSKAGNQWLEECREQIRQLPVNPIARLAALELIQGGNSLDTGIIHISEPFSLKIQFSLLKKCQYFRVFVDLRSEDGDLLFRTFDCDRKNMTRDWKCGDNTCVVSFPGHLLSARAYSLNVMAGIFEGDNCFGEGVGIRIEGHQDGVLTPFMHEPILGLLYPQANWDVFDEH